MGPTAQVWLKRSSPVAASLTVTDIRPGRRENLKAGKGINLPDTGRWIDARTAKDLEDLEEQVQGELERLAEVQEEIMWACEAGHLLVIKATQVLDGLARTGQPSRAEITDAAMAEQAECVMLNKGPHISERHRPGSGHQDKRSLFRRLRAWDHVVQSG